METCVIKENRIAGNYSGHRAEMHGKEDYRTISEVANLLDVNEWTIRMWADRLDILKFSRDNNGVIIFSPADVKKIKTICCLTKVKDITLEDVKQYLELEFK